MNILKTLAGVALMCSVITVAQAGESGSIPSVVVRYDDLNVANQAGAARLYQRIVRAAKVVCGDDVRTNLRTKSESKQCMNEAVETAVGKVNNRVLTAMHRQKATRRVG